MAMVAGRLKVASCNNNRRIKLSPLFSELWMRVMHVIVASYQVLRNPTGEVSGCFQVQAASRTSINLGIPPTGVGGCFSGPTYTAGQNELSRISQLNLDRHSLED